MLLIELLLERGFDFTNLFGAEVILDPADHDLGSQLRVRDHIFGFGPLQPHAAVSAAAAVGAVFSVDGVVDGKNAPIACVVLHVGDGPGKRCHG